MDLTIVITSKGRPDKLVRIIEHLEAEGFSGELLIGDASSSVDATLVQKRLEKAKLKSTYHWHEDLSVVKSHQFLSKKIKTTYSVCIADGGLILLNGIKNCLNLIESDPEIVAVSGNTFLFSLNDVGALKWLANYPMPHFNEVTPDERFHAICRDYKVPMYCIMRSSAWAEIWQNTHTINEQAFAAEIIPAMRLSLRGKILNINVPYLLREIHARRVHLNLGSEISKSSDFAVLANTAFGLLLKDVQLKRLDLNTKALEIDWNAFLANYTKSGSNQFSRKMKPVPNISKLVHEISFLGRLIMSVRRHNYAKRFRWSEQHKKSFTKALDFLDEFNTNKI